MNNPMNPRWTFQPPPIHPTGLSQHKLTTKQWRPAQYSANIPTIIIIQQSFDGSFIFNSYRYALVQSCRSLQHGRSQLRKSKKIHPIHDTIIIYVNTVVFSFFPLLLFLNTFNLSNFFLQSTTSKSYPVICEIDRTSVYPVDSCVQFDD